MQKEIFTDNIFTIYDFVYWLSKKQVSQNTRTKNWVKLVLVWNKKLQNLSRTGICYCLRVSITILNFLCITEVFLGCAWIYRVASITWTWKLQNVKKMNMVPGKNMIIWKMHNKIAKSLDFRGATRHFACFIIICLKIKI